MRDYKFRRITTNRFEDMIRYVFGIVTLVVCIRLAAWVALRLIYSAFGLITVGVSLVLLGAIALLKGSKYDN